MTINCTSQSPVNYYLFELGNSMRLSFELHGIIITKWALLILIFSKVFKNFILDYCRHNAVLDLLQSIIVGVSQCLTKRLVTIFISQCAILFLDVLSRGNPQQSLWLWRWMGPFLSYLFSAFWVLPLYWLSKPLNSLWYQVNVMWNLYVTCLSEKYRL